MKATPPTASTRTLSLRTTRLSLLDPIALAYAIRVALAMLIALGVSLQFQLTNPYWSASAAGVAMAPQLSRTIGRGISWFAGTTIGCALAIVVMALIAQSPTAALIVIALWVGLCTALATRARNPDEAYGAQLAAFAFLIVWIGSFEDPINTPWIAIARFTDVFIGVASALVVSSILPFETQGTSVNAGALIPPPRDALYNGLVTVGTMLIVGTIWLATAWPFGANAVLFAGAVCTLFTPLADPRKANPFLLGVLAAAVTAGLYAYKFLLHVYDFWPLALFLAPALFLGALGSLRGAGSFQFFFPTLLAITNDRRPDPTQFFNVALAFVAGCIAGMLALRIGRPGLRT